jgi:hypothetical protein
VILDWCNEYGLLGILPGQAQFIALLPIYENIDQYPGVAVAGSQRCILQRMYARVAGDWVGHNVARGETPAGDSIWRAGTPVPEAAWGKATETPCMLFWDWESFAWKNDVGNQRLSSFFSYQAENGQYPRPLSDDFWDVYQEPVWAWTRAALDFSEAAELVSQYAAARFAGKPWPAERLEDVNHALWGLNSLSASQAHSYEFGPSALRRNLAYPSLLSAMAEMFFLDMMARRRAFRCGACGKIFVSNDARSAYCSTTCRLTAHTRRYRVRQLEKASAKGKKRLTGKKRLRKRK